MVRNKENGLVLQQDLQALGEHVAPNVNVQRRQGVIQEKDVTVAVDGSRQADSLLLAAAQRQATVANLKACHLTGN